MRTPPLILVAFLSILATFSAQATVKGDEDSTDVEDFDEDELTSTPIWEDEYNFEKEGSSSAAKYADDASEGTITLEPYDGEKESTSADSSGETSEGDKKQNPRSDDMTCGDPPAVDHAKTVDAKRPPYALGALISYSCEFGYIPDGSFRFTQCSLSKTTRKAEWTKPEIICIPRSCGDPGYVVNGHRIGSVFTFPNSVTFECDEGYILQGNGVRYCHTSGRWSGSLPDCEKVVCDPPEQPLNGEVRYSSLEYGSELAYECDSGFLLKHHHPRMCSQNGSWSGNDPVCQEGVCDWPAAPEHGSVQVLEEKPSVGSLAIFTCEGGRTLAGSARSRCLDTGEWMFPTPKCLEPCAVPRIPNGKIGIYEIKYRKRKFKELPVGKQIGSRDELYLQCENKYEPLGRPSLEERIMCEMGDWREQPQCIPAMCRGSPTPTKNAVVKSANRTHGGGVVYSCNRHFDKEQTGNVKCHFGSWSGMTPVCKDSRCHTDNITFSGIRKGVRKWYNNGQNFVISCEAGYSMTHENNAFICKQGSWDSQFPPCMPASCLNQPPSLPNGRIKSFNNQHSSIVNYECDEHFQMDDSSSKVQCHMGEWKGSPPTCKNGQCYLQDLKNKEGLITNINSATSSENFLKVFCSEGYSQTGIEPFCSKGEWNQPGAPCKERDCYVHRIDNGEFTKKEQKRKWNYWGVHWDYYDEFIKVNINTKVYPDSSFYVTCQDRYSFQGKQNSNNVFVTCKKGKWGPDPVCLITGTPYLEQTTTTTTTTTTTWRPAVDDTESKVGDVTTTTTQIPVHLVINTSPEPHVPTASNLGHVSTNKVSSTATCSCTYENSDEKLVAYAGNELLLPESKVKKNCTVKFHCKDLGYYRLQGPSEITCNDCRKWHSAEFPDCVEPILGDTVLVFLTRVKILAGGTLGVEKGQKLRIQCFSNGVSEYPRWQGTTSKNIISYTYNEPVESGFYHTSILDIDKADPVQNGKYRCSLKGYRPKDVEVQVLSPVVKCSEFVVGDDLTLSYDNGQAVNSSALFSCSNNKKLIGSSVITCLATGDWSDVPPRCVTICQELTTPDDMDISYSNGLNVNSVAGFHCSLPNVRFGVPKATCLKNGSWSDPVPSCQSKMPNCDLDSIFDIVPADVIPNMENVNSGSLPYNFTVRLMCNRNLTLIGDETARCGKEAKWEVSKVQCVSGCPSLKTREDSHLIVEPDKTFYRIGDSVILSCEAGEVLTSEARRVMCLNTGWSHTEIRCIEE